MIKISVDKNGVNQLLTVLKDGAASIKDWSKPFKAFGVLLREEQKKNFDQQGAIYQGGDFIRLPGQRATTRSSSWKKLADSTKADRKKKGFGESRPILVRTGKLKRSFTTKVTPTSFTSENTCDYAGYHQTGSKDNKHPPQRKILGMSKKGVEALGLEMEKHIAGAFKMEAHKAGMVIIK